MKTPPNWVPEWGECEDCAEPIWLTSPAKRLCDKCKARRRREREKNRSYHREPDFARKQSEEQQQKWKRLQMLMAMHEKTLEEDRTRHVCTHTGSCMYGSGAGGNRWCNYRFVTGKMRTAGGKHLIKDGKCDLYKRGRTHNEVGLKL